MAKLKSLQLCPFSIALQALKRISFDPAVRGQKEMHELAYRAYLGATDVCPTCGGHHVKVDDCNDCDETGRVPRPVNVERNPPGHLLVGIDPKLREVVVNLDRDRTGHITFSADQARQLAGLLVKHAADLDGGGSETETHIFSADCPKRPGAIPEPVKRSRIRTRRTKPRAWDNTVLYDAYGRTTDCSEFCYWLGFTFELRAGKYEQLYLMEGHRLVGGEYYRDLRQICLERHHLFSVRQRPDVWSNLLIVTQDEHAWLGKNGDAGRVLCILAKCRKRAALEQPAEFSFHEMFEVFRRHFDGWVMTLPKFTGELAWVDRYRRECARLAGKMAGEEIGSK